MRVFVCCLLFLTLISIGEAVPLKEYFIVNSYGSTTGLFAQFNMVTGFLDLFEKRKCAGVRVDFKKGGLYYDETYGPNWWEYYCEPIRLGNPQQAYVRNARYAIEGRPAHFIELDYTRQYVHQLIQKYIKIKPHISNKVQRYCQKYFDRVFVIGVHYRGTDKISEAPRVRHERMIREIRRLLSENSDKHCRVFVATDEAGFLEKVQTLFPGQVICQLAMRSNDQQPIHMRNQNPYLQGEEALVDALLLSKCKILIRTCSNLSLWSTYFNPNLPVILLNEVYK